MSDVRRIWFSPYSLTPCAALGAHTTASPKKPRHGSLLKFEFQSGAIGYADLHPWTELGDQDLETQLKTLSESKFSRLSERSCELARLDSEARSQGVSVFQGLQIPTSHFLFTDLSELTETTLAEIESHGFSAFKAKAGRNLARERQALETAFKAHQKAQPKSQLKVRLDFNSTLDAKVVVEWLLSLEPSLRARVDFCEDPTPFDFAAWAQVRAQTGVDLYCDLESESLLRDGKSENPLADAAGVSGLILKPARQSIEAAKASAHKVVVTSYLDHPLGQMGAAFEAARLAQSRDVGVCGLLSQTAYELTAYSDELKTKGPQLLPSLEQSGFGFGDLLEAEPWQVLLNAKSEGQTS